MLQSDTPATIYPKLRFQPGNMELPEKAGIAHELGNLIQIASSAINIMSRSPAARSGDLEPVLTGARTSLDRAGSLVRQTLLSALRVEARPEPVEVDLCLGDVVRVARYTWPPGVGVTLTIEPGLPRVMCDPLALHNTALNLALNARDAMPDGGHIAIAARAVAAADGTQTVQVSVSDTGIGMSAETAARAFDPFFTTKSKGLGGLGLPMVRRFVAEAGGTVEIDSTPGVGTTVMLRLPAVP